MTRSVRERMRHRQRWRLACSGIVQGVGFRPYVYRLARRAGLGGWVENSGAGALIEIEGTADRLQAFLAALSREAPPACVIYELSQQEIAPTGDESFAIRRSRAGDKRAWVLPDLATCGACLEEIFDRQNRRYLYPFTNCTACGPRFSIIEDLPYDRERTTMKEFVMCARCQDEYDDPGDRRFHAQPNGCAACGPHLALWDGTGESLAERHDALVAAAAALRRGAIVAVKGLGGFHLMVDARNDDALRQLRARKRRPAKPLALLYPSLARLRADCAVAPLEEAALLSAAAPIVLLRRLSDNGAVSPLVAPGNPYLGVMLPSNPLHHLLMDELSLPVVATSGNLTDEPICIDEREALRRLARIADLFLVHDRPIARQMDDSIAQVIDGRVQVLRRGRGYAPLPLTLAHSLPQILALGGDLKSSVALAKGRAIFLSQHLGDLDNAPGLTAFEREATGLQRLYGSGAAVVAADCHPDFHSTRFALARGLPAVSVQHHHAHVFSCMADNRLDGPVLGVAWDGTGLGLDGMIWGGEFFAVDDDVIARIAHLRPFRLAGGDQAIKEPRRALLGLLYEMVGEAAFTMKHVAALESLSGGERVILRQLLQRSLHAPLASSMGRLFDAVAALLDLCRSSSFEGQAAMAVQFAAERSSSAETYPLPLVERCGAPRWLDWRPTIEAILAEQAAGTCAADGARKFHNALAAAVVSVAHWAERERVVLSGGCFQNRLLTELTVARLRAAGFQPYWHGTIPPNDGGLAVGQIIGAARLLRQAEEQASCA